MDFFFADGHCCGVGEIMWDGKVALSIHHRESRLMGPSLHEIKKNVTGHIHAIHAPEYLQL